MDSDQLTKDERLEAARKRFVEKQKKLHKPASDMPPQPKEVGSPVFRVPQHEPPRQLTAEDLFGSSESEPFYQASFPQVLSPPISTVTPAAIPTAIPTSIPVPTSVSMPAAAEDLPTESATNIESKAEQEFMDELADTDSPYSSINDKISAEGERAPVEPSVLEQDNKTKPRQMLRPEHIFDFSLGSMQEIPLDDNVDLNDDALEELVFPPNLLAPDTHVSQIGAAPILDFRSQEKPFWESENDDNFWKSEPIYDIKSPTVVKESNIVQEKPILEDLDFISPQQEQENASRADVFSENNENSFTSNSNQEERVSGDGVSLKIDTEGEQDPVAVSEDVESVSLHIDDQPVVLDTPAQFETPSVENSGLNDAGEFELIELPNKSFKVETDILQKENEELRAKIDQQLTQIEVQTTSIEGHLATIKQQAIAINEKDVCIKSRDSVLKEQRGTIEEQISIIDEHKNTILGQNETIDEQKASLDQQNLLLAEKSATIEQQKTKIDEQNLTIEEQMGTIIQLEKKLAAETSKLAETVIALEQLKSNTPVAAGSQSDLVEEQKRTIERMKKENTNLKLGRMDLNDRISELEEELEELKSSTTRNDIVPNPSMSAASYVSTYPVQAELMGMQPYDPTASFSTAPAPVAEPVEVTEISPLPHTSHVADASPVPASVTEPAPVVDAAQTTFESLFGVSEPPASEKTFQPNNSFATSLAQESAEESPGVAQAKSVADIYNISESVSKLELDRTLESTSHTLTAAAESISDPVVESAADSVAKTVPTNGDITEEPVDPLDEFESMLQSVVQSHEKPAAAAAVATSASKVRDQNISVVDGKNLYAQSPRPELSRFDTGADFRERLMVWKGWQVDMTDWTSSSSPKIAL